MSNLKAIFLFEGMFEMKFLNILLFDLANST